MGKSAQELFEMRVDPARQDEVEKVYTNALFKTVVVKCRVKQELVNEEMRPKNSVMKVDELDFVYDCKHMIEAINKYQ
jgi:hypothetical protein